MMGISTCNLRVVANNPSSRSSTPRKRSYASVYLSEDKTNPQFSKRQRTITTSDFIPPPNLGFILPTQTKNQYNNWFEQPIRPLRRSVQGPERRPRSHESPVSQSPITATGLLPRVSGGYFRFRAGRPLTDNQNNIQNQIMNNRNMMNTDPIVLNGEENEPRVSETMERGKDHSGLKEYKKVVQNVDKFAYEDCNPNHNNPGLHKGKVSARVLGEVVEVSDNDDSSSSSSVVVQLDEDDGPVQAAQDKDMARGYGVGATVDFVEQKEEEEKGTHLQMISGNVGNHHHHRGITETIWDLGSNLKKLALEARLHETKFNALKLFNIRWSKNAQEEPHREEDDAVAEAEEVPEKIPTPAKAQVAALKDAFVPLKSDEEELVSTAFKGQKRKEVLVMHEESNIEISREKLRCLLPGAWLNDEVINLYFELLKEREKREPSKFLRCHFFNTFFYKKLFNPITKYDYKAVRRWTSQRNIGYCLADCDMIFVPIHKEIHWCLGVIDMKAKKFLYLDSLKGTDSHVMEILPRYIRDEVKDKTGKDIDLSNWNKEFMEDIPEQCNGWDCGVFMIKYADFFSRGLPLSFGQDDMTYFRNRTAKEILKLRAD